MIQLAVDWSDAHGPRDASTSSDVASSGDGQMSAWLEGRLHDLDRLRVELGCARDDSAAAVVLGAYEKHGVEMLSRLRGEFALAIWSARTRELFAARDQMGLRSLAYAVCGTQLHLASEPEHLVRAGIVPPVPDENRVVDFLARTYTSSSRSFFRDVSLVPPGCWLRATERGLVVTEYRRPPARELTFESTDAAMAAVRDSLRTAVARAVPADERVLIELSGGLDSTSIACLADELLAREPTRAGRIFAASGLHPGLSCDETEDVRAVEAALHFPVLTWDATQVDPGDLSAPVLGAPGANVLMAGGSNGSVTLARERGARIIVNGTGGDQVGEPLGISLDQLRAGHWRDVLRDFSSPRSRGRRALFLRALLRHLAPAWLRRAHRAVNVPAAEVVWLSATSARAFRQNADERFDTDVRALRSERTSAGQLLRWRNVCGPAVTISVDHKRRAAGAAGLEVRFPFLDWDLVSLLLAVPFEHWPPAGANARIHREALEPLLPVRSTLRRTKAEFTDAMSNRVSRQMEAITALFDGPTWEAERYVPQRAARAFLVTFQQRQPSDLPLAYGVWAIAALETWLRALLRYIPGG